VHGSFAIKDDAEISSTTDLDDRGTFVVNLHKKKTQLNFFIVSLFDTYEKKK